MKSLEDLISLNNHTCLISGAGKGIGAAIARRFAEAGAALVLVDLDEKALHAIEKELSDVTQVRCYTADLSKKSEIDRIWKEAAAIDIDLLVNNAGSYPFHEFLELTEEDLERAMNLNLYSVLWMCRHFIERRKDKGGAIVNIGSIEAIMPFKKNLVHYSLAKSGVLTLTRDLAREFAGNKIRVNALLPGGIVTPGTKSAAGQALRELDFSMISDAYNFRQRIPAHRFGEPDEVARMALVLCSELATYVHGALIQVDGGFLSS